MSEIRFNRWSHQSGTGGIYQDSSGNIGIGTSVPTSVLDIQGGSIKIGSQELNSSGVSTFTTVNATTLTGNLTGNVTGNVTGNLTGNVTGNLTGTASTATAAATAYGISGSPTLSGITSVSTTNLTVNGSAYPSAGPLSNRNLIINGNFAINQRGGTNSSINQYALDRWRSYGGPMGFTISQQDVLSTLSTSRYAMRFQRTSGNTQTNNTGVVQGIESKNCEGLAGTQLTLSFKARAGADLSSDLDARFFYGTGTDENPVSMTSMTNDGGTDFTLTTSFATYTKTVTVPASTTQISLTFAVTPTGTAGTNDWFEVAEVQVERGSVATPFEHRSYGDELARCQRYYYKIQPGTSHSFGLGFNRNTTLCQALIRFPVTMRADPTAIETSGTASDYQVFYLTTAAECSVVPFLDYADTAGSDFYFQVASGLTAGQGSKAVAKTTNAYLAWSAEL